MRARFLRYLDLDVMEGEPVSAAGDDDGDDDEEAEEAEGGEAGGAGAAGDAARAAPQPTTSMSMDS